MQKNEQLQQEKSAAEAQNKTLAEQHQNQLASLQADSQQQILQKDEQLQQEKSAAEAQNKTLAEQHQNQLASLQADSQQQILQKDEQLQQAQSAAETQDKMLAERQEKLVFLEDNIKQQVKTTQDYKQEMNLLNDQQAKLKAQQADQKNNYTLREQQQQQAQDAALQKITQLEKSHQALASNLITEQSDIKLYQKEVESLKSQVKIAQEGQENILNRFNSNREKQEKDNDQVRETIKYLRDENSDMITQYNVKKEQFLEQIHELESKLTEYRLKFEYAQKQLTQNS